MVDSKRFKVGGDCSAADLGSEAGVEHDAGPHETTIETIEQGAWLNQGESVGAFEIEVDRPALGAPSPPDGAPVGLDLRAQPEPPWCWTSACFA